MNKDILATKNDVSNVRLEIEIFFVQAGFPTCFV